MTARELYQALGELLSSDATAGERELVVEDDGTYRTYAVVGVAAPEADQPAARAVRLQVEVYEEARCSCGGTLTYRPGQPPAPAYVAMACDSCDEPRLAEEL